VGRQAKVQVIVTHQILGRLEPLAFGEIGGRADDGHSEVCTATAESACLWCRTSVHLRTQIFRAVRAAILQLCEGSPQSDELAGDFGNWA
jgi:hypothetical protein